MTLEVVAAYLSRATRLKLEVRGDALCWQYGPHDHFNKWLYHQLFFSHAKPPPDVYQDAPCFRWIGKVPMIGDVSVLVYGEFVTSESL